jgi:hypothetical protein
MISRAGHSAAGRRRAARQRGAALLEGVVVAAACLGLLGLGLAVHAREVARLERERGLRSSAWQRALEGCAEPDRVTVLGRAALRGRAAAAAERLTRSVGEPGLVPCNEPAAPDTAEWSNASMELEHQLLPRLP